MVPVRLIGRVFTAVTQLVEKSALGSSMAFTVTTLDNLVNWDYVAAMAEGAVCVTCHGGDKGAETATAMRASIDNLQSAITRSTTDSRTGVPARVVRALLSVSSGASAQRVERGMVDSMAS